MKNQIQPSGAREILTIAARLVAQYRRGGNVYLIADAMSVEWERQGLLCPIEKHIKRHNLDSYTRR